MGASDLPSAKLWRMGTNRLASLFAGLVVAAAVCAQDAPATHRVASADTPAYLRPGRLYSLRRLLRYYALARLQNLVLSRWLRWRA